jgi:ABC-type nitrate/sulfonate/bicarbonate transport system permease component
VILPSLTPGVLLGVRVSSALALIVALLTDIFGAGTGIGRLLIESQQRFDAATAWGLLLIVGAFGYLTNSALARLSGVPYASADAANPRTAAPSRSR